jgi:two-component system response regulator AlgR
LAQSEVLVIQERGRTERVPVAQILYFKAELKYVTVRTVTRSYILDGSLNELEEKYRSGFVRIHRNALIARRAVRALEKHFDAEEGDGWAVRLNGVDELLAVSRRQLASRARTGVALTGDRRCRSAIGAGPAGSWLIRCCASRLQCR